MLRVLETIPRVTPIHFPQANKIFTGPEAGPLPAHVRGDLGTSGWQFSWRDRLKLLCTGRLWAQTSAPLLGLALTPPALPSSKLKVES